MLLPKARGDLSDQLFGSLRRGDVDHTPVTRVDAEDADDAAISLWALYELHYRGFEDAPDDAEWDGDLLGLRRRLEHTFEDALRTRFLDHAPHGESAGDFAEEFFRYVGEYDGPSLASHVHRHADREQVLDLLRARSVYHLKEADPVAWVVPRLSTVPKAALMELVFDEYGNGDPNRLHHHLFAEGMAASGLSPAYGAYVDDAPVEVLEQNNAMSLFGLHRRLRGASLGHLAAFEATSSVPSRRMAQGLERLGFPSTMIGYYTEHVEADAVHEQLAVRAICGALLDEEPQLTDDVFLGAFACMDLEDRVARRLLADWRIAA